MNSVPLVNNKIAERVFGNEINDVKISFETGKVERGNFSGGTITGRWRDETRTGRKKGRKTATRRQTKFRTA